ncbi:MAG: hypothetical protein V3T86_03515, partial [Planctomycetota bacterium]
SVPAFLPPVFFMPGVYDLLPYPQIAKYFPLAFFAALALSLTSFIVATFHYERSSAWLYPLGLNWIILAGTMLFWVAASA